MSESFPPKPYPLKSSDLDYALSTDGLACESELKKAQAQFAAATCEEDRTKAKASIDHWSTMAHASAEWIRYSEIKPIGHLFVTLDGDSRVVLSHNIEMIRHSFIAKGNHDPEAEKIRTALSLIMHSDPSTEISGMDAALNWQMVQTKLGARLRALTSCSAQKRSKEMSKLKKDLAQAVDRIAKPGFAKPRPNASQVSVCDETGKEHLLRLEVLVIDTARHLAERHKDTPAKGDIRVELCACFPNLQKNKDSTWTDVWERCGFKDLPTAPKWSVSGKTTG